MSKDKSQEQFDDVLGLGFTAAVDDVLSWAGSRDSDDSIHLLLAAVVVHLQNAVSEICQNQEELKTVRRQQSAIQHSKEQKSETGVAPPRSAEPDDITYGDFGYVITEIIKRDLSTHPVLAKDRVLRDELDKRLHSIAEMCWDKKGREELKRMVEYRNRPHSSLLNPKPWTL